MNSNRPVRPAMTLADVQAKNTVLHTWPTYDADRPITQSDIDSAIRGLNMLGKSVNELSELIAQHKNNDMFASKVIVRAAEQMKAAKLRAGAAKDAALFQKGTIVVTPVNGNTGTVVESNEDMTYVKFRDGTAKWFDTNRLHKMSRSAEDDDESEKQPKAAVDYSEGTGDDRCSNCQHFQPGDGVMGACELVEGPIDPDGWCKLFETKGQT